MVSLHSSFPKKPKKADYDADAVRHLILNMIRFVNHKFKDKYGEVVLCCDSESSWRKKVYPYYKAHRKSARDLMDHIDWPIVFELFNQVKEELKTYTKYPVIEVDGAEGDDVIGSLVLAFPLEPHMIISRDKDFQQLQAYGGVVDQYDPVDKRLLIPADRGTFLKEHILRGDRNDGVPNILSDDDVLVTPGKRQGKMTAKRLEEFMATPMEEWVNNTHKRNWKRNELLIDLRCAPPSVSRNVLQQYNEQHGARPHRVYKYLVDHGVVGLLDVVDQF